MRLPCTYSPIARYSSQTMAAGVQAKFVQMTLGDPGPVICNFAKAEKADLVFVGDQKCWDTGETAADSIISYVVCNAPCSVMVVREQAIATATTTAASETAAVSLSQFSKELISSTMQTQELVSSRVRI